MKVVSEKFGGKIAGDELMIAFGRKFIVRIFGDDFKWRATAIVIFCFFSSAAVAGVDLDVGAEVRSYPLSGVVEADAGYDFLLWGTHTAGDSQQSSPWYGYLRPHIDGSTAGTYNQLGGSVDIYPLSFLGGRFGGEGIQNDANYTAYDCQTYECRGRFYRTYAQADLTLGAAGFFVQARWRRERWTQGAVGIVDFIEPTSGLALRAAGDAQTYYRGTFGYKFNTTWSAAAALVYYQSDISNEISRFPFAVVRFQRGPLSLGIGGGVYEGSLKSQAASALLILDYNIIPSLRLQ